MIQLEYHAWNHVAGNADVNPSAVIVETPEITADMMIDTTKAKATGARRIGIIVAPLIHYRMSRSNAYIRTVWQQPRAIGLHEKAGRGYRGKGQ